MYSNQSIHHVSKQFDHLDSTRVLTSLNLVTLGEGEVLQHPTQRTVSRAPLKLANLRAQVLTLARRAGWLTVGSTPVILNDG